MNQIDHLRPTAPQRETSGGGSDGFLRSVVTWTLITVLILAVPAAVPAQDEDRAFRVGFSRSLFSDVNDSDARASIRAWSQTVARENRISMDPTAHLFDHTNEMASAMQDGVVDLMSTTFDEYLEISRDVETSDWFATRTAGELSEEYILLVSVESGITRIEELEGKAIVMHASARTSLAMDWLDHLVMANDPGVAAEEFFGGIRPVERVSAAVLPVFFDQAVASVVAYSSFTTMYELNPQLHRGLRVIARSPPLLPAIMFFRKGFESPEKERIHKALGELQTTAAGQQVLTLFQSEALVPVDEEYLNRTEEFLFETRRLRNRRMAGERATPDSP